MLLSEASPFLRLTFPNGPRLFFDGEWVVFNPASWEVHILNEAASAVYEYLAQAPRSLQEIECLLQDLLVEDERRGAGEHAQRVIRELASLGLVVGDVLSADDCC